MSARLFSIFFTKKKCAWCTFLFCFFYFLLYYTLYKSLFALQVVTLFASLYKSLFTFRFIIRFTLFALPVTLVNTLSLRVSEYLTTLNKHHEVVLGELNSRCPIEFLAPDKNGRTLQDRVLVSKDG